jgi:hypothetical protein
VRANTRIFFVLSHATDCLVFTLENYNKTLIRNNLRQRYDIRAIRQGRSSTQYAVWKTHSSNAAMCSLNGFASTLR